MISSPATVSSNLATEPILNAFSPERDPSTKDNIIAIAQHGDLLLEIGNVAAETACFYMVSSIVLRKTSSYFSTLLSSKFREGSEFEERHTKLLETYKHINLVPSTALPIVRIFEIGWFPSVLALMHVMTHFLDILHGINRDHVKAGFLPNHAALLAMVADRFDAADPIRAYMIKNEWVHSKKGIKKNVFYSSAHNAELLARQRIYAGVILGISPWVMQYSALLIDKGSRRWIETAESESGTDSDGPWWNLPRGLEDELAHRRECILKTVSSVQTFFLDKYMSGKQQCKLGYDSSAQCDSFQLGEAIRFLTRKGLLRLHSRITEDAYYPLRSRSISEVLQSFRGCPKYQIDKNHTHCGMRNKLQMPLALLCTKLMANESSGVCLDCWNRNRDQHSWLGISNKGEVFDYEAHIKNQFKSWKVPPCGVDHVEPMRLFTSDSWVWF